MPCGYQRDFKVRYILSVYVPNVTKINFLPFLFEKSAGLYKYPPQMSNTTLTEEFPQLPHELVNKYLYRPSFRYWHSFSSFLPLGKLSIDRTLAEEYFTQTALLGV